MKKMKRIITLAVAMIMVLAMGTTAFAAQPESGSVTVNKSFKGQTYTLYKLFDAEITFKADGTREAINYKLPAGKSLDGNKWFELKGGYVVAKAGTGADWAKDPAAINWAKNFGTAVQTPIKADADNDPNVKWTGLDWGYYFVDSTLGAFISVNTDDPNAVIVDKNSLPSIDKKITKVQSGNSITDATDTNEMSDVGKGEAEHALAQVGDVIDYQLTVNAKPGAENYVVTDTLSTGLTPPAAKGVTVAGLTAGDDYTVDVTGQVIKVTFKKAYLDTITADTTINITYQATLNEKAEVGTVDGNDNTAKLTWGNDPDHDVNYSEDKSKVWSAKVGVNKKIDTTDGKPLAGAGFKLKKSDGNFYKWDETNKKVTWVAEADADEFFTDTEGKLTKEFTGLTSGTYTLVESTVPDGYTKMNDEEVQITKNNLTIENLAQEKTVINKQGTVLPTTGGIGTTIFYIVGAILMIGAGVMLVTRKRMAK